MLASGAADGFYFDNTYLRASFDENFGSAYRDDDGTLHPGVDLFALREFLKRVQTLAWQHRRSWVGINHMTTTPIVPVQVWAAVTLDGEWKFGGDDYQDRFSRDFLRASSLGTQSGTVPAFIPGLPQEISGPESERLERSLAGTTAVHEIRVMANPSATLELPWKHLLAFGYGKPECRVHRYWDDPQVVDVLGVDAEALAVVCGGRALALVTSFGREGPLELRFDAAALGLPPSGACWDAERRGEDPPRPTPGGCAFSIRRHDFRLIGYGS